MATDEADSDNKFSPEDYGEEDKENNEADVEFEFEMKSDSDSDRLRPGCHRSDTTVHTGNHTPKSRLNSTQGDADSAGQTRFVKRSPRHVGLPGVFIIIHLGCL